MPGFCWAKNMFMPTTLSEEEMEQIPSPRIELHVHVLTKTVQAGIILGGGVIAPVIALIRKKPVLATMRRAAIVGAGIGAAAGPVMTELVLRKSNEDAICDRSYRLRYNRNQVRTDRFAYFSAVAGGAATLVQGAGLLPGVVAGMGIGTLLGGVYNATMAESAGQRPERTVFLSKDK